MFTENHLLRNCYLLLRPLVYVRIDSHIPPLWPEYKRSFRVLEKHNKYFVLDLLSETDRVFVDRLKVARLSVDTVNQSLFSHRAISPSSNSLVGSSQRYPPATVSPPSQHVSSSNHDTAKTSRPVMSPLQEVAKCISLVFCTITLLEVT